MLIFYSCGITFYRRRDWRNNLLDSIDRKILRSIQTDATRPISEIADEVGLSPSPCWKRIKRLEAEGFILGRVALLARDRLDLGVTVFVAVRTNQHDKSWLEQFAQIVSDIPEVMEFYRMSGEVDYLIKIICKDIADYDRIYKSLVERTSVFDVNSSFTMEQIKYTTKIPI